MLLFPCSIIFHFLYEAHFLHFFTYVNYNQEKIIQKWEDWIIIQHITRKRKKDIWEGSILKLGSGSYKALQDWQGMICIICKYIICKLTSFYEENKGYWINSSELGPSDSPDLTVYQHAFWLWNPLRLFLASTSISLYFLVLFPFQGSKVN